MGEPGNPTADPPLPPTAGRSYRGTSAWAQAELGVTINYLAIRKHRLEHMSGVEADIDLGESEQLLSPSAQSCPDESTSIGTETRSRADPEAIGLAPPPPEPPSCARAPAPVVAGEALDGDPILEVVAEPMPEPTPTVRRVVQRPAAEAAPRPRRVVMNVTGLPTETAHPVIDLLRAAAGGHGRITAADANALDKWSSEFFGLVDRFRRRRARASNAKKDAEVLEADVALGQLLVHGGHSLAQICKARKQLTGLAMSPQTKRAMGGHDDDNAGIKGLIGQLGERPPPIDGDEPDAPEEESEVAKGYPEEQAPPPAQTGGVASFDDLPDEEPPGFEEDAPDGLVAVAERGHEGDPVLVPVDPGDELAGEGELQEDEGPTAMLEPTGTEGASGGPVPARTNFIWQPKAKPKSWF